MPLMLAAAASVGGRQWQSLLQRAGQGVIGRGHTTWAEGTRIRDGTYRHNG
jgi:hypothetical protein